jgi:hypothetical protein
MDDDVSAKHRDPAVGVSPEPAQEEARRPRRPQERPIARISISELAELLGAPEALTPEERAIRTLRDRVETLTYETWCWAGLAFVLLLLLIASGRRR